MEETERSLAVALKEWAVACEALGRGEQSLLLRKGGIREENREFRVEQAEFLLFPTYEHQRVELVKSRARAELEALAASCDRADQVELRYWAAVTDVFELSDPDQLAAVAPFHLWSEDYALERLRWRPRKPLQLVALRVHRLAEPLTLTVLPEYGGCTSWIHLAQAVPLEGSTPVLDDQAFQDELVRIRQALAGLALGAVPA